MAEFSNKAGRIESPAMGFSASAPLERDWFLGMQDKSKRQDMNKATLESDTVESPIARQNSGAEIADRLSDRRHQSLHFDERKHEQSPRNSELETYFRLRRHRNLNRKKLLLKAFLLSLYTPAQIGIVSLVLQYMQCSKGLVLLFFISSLLFGIARFYCQYRACLIPNESIINGM
ncbi:hypothetical protein SPOG_02366 [Schizosaccharomyces cryophilus OY26]|uniref:Uncharacterized protein n=1 Tax=Schizosaccharomyces cryophilus (strain OY26 / ATCC MYA-4695 / CBS 11777 / NBRC 106824 / NRRL Y48691) TaxID=653667 RepID=S9VY74_SCHCR|nr:uncharacterized protein SPOG_02366 [Schizosaccharomyces cryophilus OY26]EPY51189.1 hypothetical protein SPOG_02366 [Schizosaccharomyces cryophilus OY26]